MPFMIWSENDDGTLRNHIETDWDTSFRGEEYRLEAEALDAEIDKVLDRAAELVASPTVRSSSARASFKTNWAFGRAVADSGILAHPSLKGEQIKKLWIAMAAKARLGIASRGSNSATDKWRLVRDATQPDRTSKSGGVRDKYQTAIWLQQHDIDEAAAIFGGDLGNAREIGARTGINVFPLRQALGRWIEKHDDGERRVIHNRANFQLIAKALRKRWPARGPGSAQSPEHLSPADLDVALADVLDPVLADILKDTDTVAR